MTARHWILAASLCCSLATTGCPAPAPEPTDETETDAEAEAESGDGETDGTDADTDDSDDVYDVVCGCTLEAVGHCGEYARVDGEFVEITGDLGLGSMPFCGQDGLRAEIEGEVQDGEFQATSLELVTD